MKIDRSNYEIWFIDWLDGNLDDHQIGQLRSFLSENPELKGELDALSLFSFKPSGEPFSHKDMLKKLPADLPGSQFDYLSVAHLENDLSTDQLIELKEIIEKDPEKKRVFELIQKMKLSHTDDIFINKNRLRKKTPAQRVLHLSAIGLSAAAIISLIITIYIFAPRYLPGEIDKTAQNIIIDSSSIKSSVPNITNTAVTTYEPVIKNPDRKVVLTRTQKSVIRTTFTSPEVLVPIDSSLRNMDIPAIVVLKVPVSPEIDLSGGMINNSLIASSITFIEPPAEDERSRLNKFIARTFREKILKEKTSGDSPLRGYEIAEAGINGINKLFGWEMALQKNNDENGELKSVYFSSKMLKFNVPVKKGVSVQ